MMEIVDPLARGQLATHADVLALRSDMDALRTELRAEMGALRAEVRSDLAQLTSDLSRTFATWLFLSQGVMVAIVGLLLSIR